MIAIVNQCVHLYHIYITENITFFNSGYLYGITYISIEIFYLRVHLKKNIKNINSEYLYCTIFF